MALLGRGEDAREVLLGLADVLGDDRGQVDPVQLEPELAGQDLGGQGLAGARGAGEQRGDPLAAGDLALEAPVLEDLPAVLDVGAKLAELGQAVGRQHQVVPGGERRDLARQGGEDAAGLGAARVIEGGGFRGGFRGGARAAGGLGYGAVDAPGVEGEALGQGVETGLWGGGEAVAADGRAPQRPPLREARGREVDPQQRGLAQPARRPGEGGAEDERAGETLQGAEQLAGGLGRGLVEERLGAVEIDGAAEERRFARQPAGESADLGPLGEQGRRVHFQQAEAGFRAQGLGGEPPAGSGLPLEHQAGGAGAGPGAQRLRSEPGRQHHLGERRPRHGPACERREPLVGQIEAEEEVDDAVVEAQRAGGEGSLVLGGGPGQQAVAQQRCSGREAGMERQPLAARRREQGEDQAGGRTAAGDVVLQVGVELLAAVVEPRSELRRQAQQQRVDIERGEREALRQLGEGEPDPGGQGGGRALLQILLRQGERREQVLVLIQVQALVRAGGRGRDRLAQPADLLLRDVEAAELVELDRRRVAPPPRHGQAQQQVDPAERREQVLAPVGVSRRGAHRGRSLNDRRESHTPPRTR